MSRPADQAKQVARAVRRVVARGTAKAGSRGDAAPAKRPASSGTGSAPRSHRIVLVGVSPAEANAFLRAARLRPTGPMPTVLAAADLKEKDQRVESGEVTVVARSLADLRRATPWLVRAGRSAQVTLGVVATTRARRLAAPTVVAGTEVVRVERHQVAGGLALSVRLSASAPVRDVLRAVLQEARPAGRAAPSAGLRIGVTAYDALPFAAGDPTAQFVGPKTTVAREVEHELIDFLVGPAVHAEPDPRIVHLSVGEQLWLPPVDTAVLSPVGFRREASGVGSVRLAAGDPPTLTLSGSDGAVLSSGDARPGLTENQIEALRGLDGVEVDSAAEDLTLLGRVLTQLACAGVPVRPLPVPPALAGALGDELAARLSTEWDPGDALDRESWSVSSRRAALRRFAPEGYWGDLARRHDRPAVAAPSVSVLVPTRRADFLPFALGQVERQDYPDLETVLVLHGIAADDPSVQKAIAGFGRPLVVVEVPGDALFGAALNAGVARCSGRLLTKMDDDDWYGPHHLTDLVLARAYSGATVVGLTGYHVYLHDSDTTIRWTAPATEAPAGWLAGGTMLLGLDDVRGLGGWRATPSAVDWHLLAAVRTAGGWLYATHDLGFLYYRGHEHTWTPAGGKGDAVWLERDPSPRAGFHPPPHLDPLTHPRAG